MDIKDSLIALAVIVVWGVNFYFMKLALSRSCSKMLAMSHCLSRCLVKSHCGAMW